MTPARPTASELPVPRSDGSDLAEYVREFIRARHRIGLAGFVGLLLGALWGWLLPQEYTAEVALLPSDDADFSPSSLLDPAASSFGATTPAGVISQSEFYPAVLLSDPFLGELANEEFPPRPGEARIPLARILAEGTDLEGDELHAHGVAALRSRVVRAHRISETGIVSLRVTTHEPSLSVAIAERLTKRLGSYLADTRRAAGARSTEHVSLRLEAVHTDLARAEVKLVDFRTANRRRADSPELLLQEERLLREVVLQERIFVELQRQSEGARVEELRNTPMLRVLDAAHLPLQSSRPNATILATMGAVLGILVGLWIATARVSLTASPDLVEALRPLAVDWQWLRRRVHPPRAIRSDG